MKDSKIKRREFIKKSSAIISGIMIVPSYTVSGLGYTAPSDKMNVVGIGVGGKGHINLNAMNTENIIGLCDVDWTYATDCFNAYPKAKRYKDWRVMFDELGESIDGVMVATSDHTHAIITAHAITMGKHVFCQKPLTHSIYESRLLTKLAAKYKVATQMGNQGASGHGVNQVCEWLWNGEIGEVKEVHAWTNRPIWPQGLERPEETPSLPPSMAWDLFIGPAPWRPYHPAYTPWNWRGWWDFGTGAFGDMGCHVLEPVYRALKIKFPESVSGNSTEFNTESAPQSEKVKYTFAPREAMEKLQMPEVEVHWYDGGLMPDRPEALPDGESMLKDKMGGCLFIGSKDTLFCDTGGFKPRLLSGREPYVKPYLRRIPGATGYIDGPHEQDWIRACKEPEESRMQPVSSFDYSGPFNEMVLLGVLAVRLKSLNRILDWDGELMQFKNISDNDLLRVISSNEFKIIGGHPHFNTEHIELNALEAVSEYIKHTYRNGWSLPDMTG